MRVFVTGASGWIGSAAVAELLAAGHEVTGLARSDASAAALAAVGATPHRGSLDDLDSLRAGAEAAEGVVHLAFNHDFSDYVGAGRTERAAVTALGDALAGSERPLLLAAGVAGLSAGVATERDRPSFNGPDAPRGGSEGLALEYAERGVRSISVRFAPTVHGEGDHGFVAAIVAAARRTGVSGYVGDGTNRWSAVARADAGRVVRLALEQAPAGTVVHAVGEEGIATKDIAVEIGRGLGLPTASIEPDAAVEHFGWIGRFFGMNAAAASATTQSLLGWAPAGPHLLTDLEAGYYYR